jgi:hypothetical protein
MVAYEKTPVVMRLIEQQLDEKIRAA